MEFNIKKEIKTKKLIGVILFIVLSVGILNAHGYNGGYSKNYHSNIRETLNYTSENKQNVYICTMPAMQYRFLAYSVYEMPPEGAFSNVRLLGGWEFYTQNYYEFNERYGLDGTFLDLLKDNVYLVDGDIMASDSRFKDYYKTVIESIENHYEIKVDYELIKEFNGISIYKLKEAKK